MIEEPWLSPDQIFYGALAFAFLFGLVLGNMVGFARGLLKGFNIAKGEKAE